MVRILEKCTAQGLAEFVLIAPVFLLLILCIFQAGLIMNAHICVKFAAYRAVRSLIVHTGEKSTEDALSKMKSSAALGLLSISSSTGNGKPSLSKIDPGTIALPVLFGLDPAELAGRYTTALNNLKAHIVEPQNILKIKRGTKVKVRLDYSYDLTVPIAGRLFHKYLVSGNNPFSGRVLSMGCPSVTISKFASMRAQN